VNKQWHDDVVEKGQIRREMLDASVSVLRKAMRRAKFWRLAASVLLVALVIALALLAYECAPSAAPMLPDDPVMTAKIEAATVYINSVNPEVNAREVARLLITASWEAGLDPGFWLLVAISEFETHFRLRRIGKGGERGLLQIHPIHKTSMRRAGLDFYAERDRLLFGAQLITGRLSKGESLPSALRPWTVHLDALRRFYGLQKRSRQRGGQ